MQRAAGKTRIRQDPAGVPDDGVHRGQPVGLFEKSRRLRRHTGGQQRDQYRGGGEQRARRNPQQAEIGQQANRDPERQSGKAAQRHVPTGVGLGRTDAIQEQHHLAALAQYGDADHDRKRQ